MNEGWACYVVAHIVPLDDGIEHTQSPDCVCGPREIEETLADGSTGTQMIHAALDGRELIERSST